MRSVSQHVFHREASKVIFNIPRNPDYEKENKPKESISWWRTEITPALPIAEQNFPRHFGQTFEKSLTLFKILHVFVPRFLWEFLTRLYRTLVEETTE